MKYCKILAITGFFLAFSINAEEKFNYEKYIFLFDNKWEGVNNYDSDIHTFEIKPFKQKEGSKLYKIRRQGFDYFLREIVNGKTYFPEDENDEGSKILELSTEEFIIEGPIIRLSNGKMHPTTFDYYRVFNWNYKKDTDFLYGDWESEKGSGEYSEYRIVRGDYEMLIYIPDYDWASKYNEDGWHYLKYVDNDMFETDDAFPDVRFKLRVESEKEIILIPMFQKHDMSDGIIKLHPVK